MPSLRHKIIARSRDRNFLVRWMLIILAVGGIAGYAMSHFGPAAGNVIGDLKFEDVLKSDNPYTGEDEEGPDEEAEDTATEAHGTTALDHAEQVAAKIRKAPEAGREHIHSLDAENRHLFTDFVDALTSEGEPYVAARDELAKAALEVPPPRFASEFHAYLLMKAGDYPGAAKGFRMEAVDFPKSQYSHRAEIHCLMRLDAVEALDQRLDDEAYIDHLSHTAHMNALVKTGRWWELTWRSNAAFFEQFSFAWALVTLFAGGVWFLVIGLLAGIEEKPKSRTLLYGAGFVLGLLSVVPVMPIIYYQSMIIGLDENGEFLNDAVFFISGVGLREEVCKLFMFALLLPVLLKRRSSMEALAAAGCVGLGFAVNENVGYSRTGTEEVLIGRMLTANFAHVALTGILGLALFHFVRWPKTRWEEFVATFVGIVVAHGLYNLFIGGYWSAWLAGLAPLIIFAMLVNRYLGTAREVREGPSPALSPLAVFVLGGTAVVSLSWMHACWHVPLAIAMLGVGFSAVSIGVIAFLFVNALRHE